LRKSIDIRASRKATSQQPRVGFAVPGEFQICRHLRPRVQDELSQSFDFLIFKRGNQIQTGLFKGERVSLTRRAIAQSYSLA
jgi:hypothetical protein